MIIAKGELPVNAAERIVGLFGLGFGLVWFVVTPTDSQGLLVALHAEMIPDLLRKLFGV